MRVDEAPVTADLVLLGGGHSHLFVLRHFAMNPLAGVRLTLVTRDLHTPYSGMLPGLIAGHYDFDDAHIDLLRLARFAGARVIHDTVVAVDADARQIEFAARPALEYDLLSINIGSRPQLPAANTGDGQQFAVKPVDRFIDSWQRLEKSLLDHDGEFRLAIIGGGAGGVELALSLEYRLRRLTREHGRLRITLLTERDRLLPGHNASARRYFEDILRRRSIDVCYGHHVSGLDGGFLQGDFDAPLAADAAIWVTHAGAAAWLRDSGLELDRDGFIAVNTGLQSLSHDDVFAAGDTAAVLDCPRPKSGVFAVRQGLPLARNLARRLQRQPLRAFRPQKRFLSLISTGDRYAVASRGAWALRGRWCWWLKDKIDRRFIERFSSLPEMGATEDASVELAPMRCGGCGSKVGSEVLGQVLGRINERNETGGGEAFDHPDDAALIEVPAGRQLIQSVDHFRSFIDDPYLFGRIAANHALGDLHAMGVAAHSAMVIANVVFASEARQAQDLYQLMSGVVETLAQHGTRLAGGHSGEAGQMSCGLSVNGFARAEELLLKSGMQPGDLLILTRPLGSGVLFAAEMQGRARGAWIDAAVEHMLESSHAAAQCLRRFDASACTDVTGFGFAGHLLEMARASACAVEIRIDQLPLYAGAADLAGQGIQSSLLPQNIRVGHAIGDPAELAGHESYPLLFDPQTAGGLLASIDARRAGECLRELQAIGYPRSRIVARAIEARDSQPLLSLVNS